jgi:P-type conjugative transfer protein TrbJ
MRHYLAELISALKFFKFAVLFVVTKKEEYRENMKNPLLALLICIFLGYSGQINAAGIPTVDTGAIAQQTITAMENVSQTLKQLEQYQTQLLQYERQLLDAANPALWQWDEASTTINNLMRTLDQLEYYKQQVGNIDSYLSQFKDIQDYRTDWAGGLTEAHRQEITNTNVLANASQKQANDALIRSLEARQQNLYRDAQNLQSLQSRAQGATGQMQALQYANQLASHQSNQLLEIRAALIAQQNVLATQAQEETTRRAQQQAAHERLSEYTPTRTTKTADWGRWK